jgi:hypothetical protein
MTGGGGEMAAAAPGTSIHVIRSTVNVSSFARKARLMSVTSLFRDA